MMELEETLSARAAEIRTGHSCPFLPLANDSLGLTAVSAHGFFRTAQVGGLEIGWRRFVAAMADIANLRTASAATILSPKLVVHW